MSEQDLLLKQFGLHVKALRQNLGLTQVSLAEKGGFDRNYIGMVERGERNPSLKTMKKMSDSLEVPLTKLVDFVNKE